MRKKIGIASLIMMGSVFLSRIIGLLREMVIAHIGGTGAEVDAYQVAFIIPEILNHVLASGFLAVTFIPMFSKYLTREKTEEGWLLCNRIVTVFGVFLVGFVALAIVFSSDFIAWLAPGIENPEILAKATRMTRIIIPAQLFFFFGGIFTAVQFAMEKFALPALAPLIYNAGIILGGVWLGPVIGMEGFSWGVLGGSFFGNFVLQYYGAKRLGYAFQWKFELFHADVKKYMILTLPLMLGLTMTFSTEFFMRFFGSYLPEGSIAGMNYAIRVLFILVGLFGQAVGVASFPYLAKLAAGDAIDHMNDILNDTLKALTVVIPISVLVMVLRHEVVAMLFEHGQFDAESTRITARALVYLMMGAYAFSAQTIVVRGFFALQNTWLPAVFGTLAVLLSLPFYFYGLKFMGVGGLSMAISLSACIQIFLIYTIWNRKHGNGRAGKVYAMMAKITALSLPVGFLLEYVRLYLISVFPFSPFFRHVCVSGVVFFLFAIIFLVLCRVLRIQEIYPVVNRVVNRVLRLRRP